MNEYTYRHEYTYRRADNGEFGPWEAKLKRDGGDRWIVRLLNRKGQFIASAQFPDQAKADAYARRRIGL